MTQLISVDFTVAPLGSLTGGWTNATGNPANFEITGPNSGGTGWLQGAYVQNSYQGTPLQNLGQFADELLGKDTITGFIQPSPGAIFGGNPGSTNYIQKIDTSDSDFTREIRTGAVLPSGGIYTGLPGAGNIENYYRVTGIAPYNSSITSQVQNIHWPGGNTIGKMYYHRQWTRFDPQAISKLTGIGNFLAILEHKTATSTWRCGMGVHAEGGFGTQPGWYMSCDSFPSSGYQVQWQIDFDPAIIPVPQNQWFLLEYANLPSANPAVGWVWAAINGVPLAPNYPAHTASLYSTVGGTVTIANGAVRGKTRGNDNEDINRIFYNMFYTSATRPFFIDIARAEMWTHFPPDATNPHPAYP